MEEVNPVYIRIKRVRGKFIIFIPKSIHKEKVTDLLLQTSINSNIYITIKSKRQQSNCHLIDSHTYEYELSSLSDDVRRAFMIMSKAGKGWGIGKLKELYSNKSTVVYVVERNIIEEKERREILGGIV